MAGNISSAMLYSLSCHMFMKPNATILLCYSYILQFCFYATPSTRALGIEVHGVETWLDLERP